MYYAAIQEHGGSQDDKLSATPASYLLQNTHRPTSIRQLLINQSLHFPCIGNKCLTSDTETDPNEWRIPF